MISWEAMIIRKRLELDVYKRQVYEIVKEAQQRGIDAVKPGARMCDVDLACRNYITEKGYGEYFTHRTGPVSYTHLGRLSGMGKPADYR